MSHANGKVYLNGKVAAYFEYDGTSDVVLTRMRGSMQEVCDHWRQGNWQECTCGNPPTPVVLYTDYGDGYHWPGEACFECMAITGGIRLSGDPVTGEGWIETTDGKPPKAPK